MSLLCLCSTIHAEYNVYTKVIRFEKGKSSAIYEEAVIRGDRDLYIFSAHSGQNMFIRVTSLENNAVFCIYEPGYWLSAEDQIIDINGNILKGQGGCEASETKSWSGKLEISGDYLISVGGTRGNAKYKLEIVIK